MASTKFKGQQTYRKTNGKIELKAIIPTQIFGSGLSGSHVT